MNFARLRIFNSGEGTEVEGMMSDSGNHSDFLAKKARNARRKRLRILRNRSLMDTLTPEIDRTFVEDAGTCKGKKRPAAAADFSDFSPNVAADGINDDELSNESGGAERIGLLVSSACEEKESENSLINYVSYGTISLIGRRRVMEDAVTVVPGGEFAIFAVYDGHGGDRVSKACRLRLHQLVLEKIDGQTMLDGCSGEWEKVMKECFSKMDEEVNSSGGDGDGDGDGDGGGGMEGCSSVVTGKRVGSTAVVVVVGEKEVVVANCGDSRAVLCRGGIPVPLSHDHKPGRADERERVEAAGGRVINWNGSRILGVLAISRSIGDEYLKPYVIAEPEVDICKRTALDEFLIIASDGLWDVVPNDFACDVTRKCLNGQMSNEGTNSALAAAMLAELALARGSKDNISVIVVELKRCSSNLS